MLNIVFPHQLNKNWLSASQPSGRLDFYSKCFWSLLVFDLNFASARGLTTIMVPTLVSSNPHIFFDEAHGVQPTTLLDLDEQPAVLVDKALQTMKREGIQVIEWRALLYRRMKVPVFVKNFHYVVPDNQLESASACLSNLGLPLMPLSDFRINVDGDFHLKGKFHRITVGLKICNKSLYTLSHFPPFPCPNLLKNRRCISTPLNVAPRSSFPVHRPYMPPSSAWHPSTFLAIQCGSICCRRFRSSLGTTSMNCPKALLTSTTIRCGRSLKWINASRRPISLS